MKSGKHGAAALGAVLFAAAVLHSQVPSWAERVPAGAMLRALFRSVPMPGGAVFIRRPPVETRHEITGLIASQPRGAELYRARAEEDELALDFAAAEADWKTYAQDASNAYQAQVELADFYHRRIRPRDEVVALTAAAQAKDDPLKPATAQRAWQAFERMASVIEGDGLPVFTAISVYRTWAARYPNEPQAGQRLVTYLIDHRQFAAAEREISRYAATFHDGLYAVRERAELELRRGLPDAAIRVYDAAFQPLWPDDMAAAYFKLLEDQGQLREFVGNARTALAANPTDLNAAARLYHYFHSQNNTAAARRVLLEYRAAKDSRKEVWSASDLETIAQLFALLPDVNEAARAYYALYSVPPSSGEHVQRALAGIANLLLNSSSAPIAFGSGDLSFYKDIATIDLSPGFLNGILSLLFNGTGPRSQYLQQNQKALAWFHQAAASQVVALLEQRFPNSAYRDGLRARLISAYAAYGDDDEVIRAGRAYLRAFPRSANRLSVALEMADALARKNQVSEEFALYDQFLRELASQASGVPIGGGIVKGEAQARSPDYVRVLDRYLSRLVASNRIVDALQVYRTELDRNSNDPGLYERLAAFLEQHGAASDVAAIYTRAIAKFPDRSWYHKLARWYLRTRQASEFEAISRRVVSIFSGTELEQYFAEVVSQTAPDAALYRQLNLYAHQRFPQDLVFVRNLMAVYARKETYDAAASGRLLREYWFYDPSLRTQFFAGLARQRRLYTELAAVRKANPDIVAGRFDRVAAANPAAAQFAAEAEGWLSHFEAAAPAARALATAYPGNREYTGRAASLYRSLAAYDSSNTEIAATLAQSEYQAQPRDAEGLAKIGDIYADRRDYARARPFWNRMPDAQPGKAEAYLDAATVFWDYYLYNDALHMIRTARKKFAQPALFAYQEGAIDENLRDYRAAVDAYVTGAIAGDMQSESRLIHLAARTQTRDLVERATAQAVSTDSAWPALSVRIAVLEAQRRRPELQSLLESRIPVESSAADLNRIAEAAARNGFDTVQEGATERLVAITNDPVDKMRLTLDLARLYESKKDLVRAGATVDALYRANPAILGVVRGAVDFHVRNQQYAAAIAILLEAAGRARPDYAGQFTLEAAHTATDAGEFNQARSILGGLLAADPYRPEYLSAMADTYLRAQDDRGFRDYQLYAIGRMKQSGLPPATETAAIAGMRRSLIPVLTRMGDFAGATEQYIEVLNRYPEDETLTKEAASYAVAHNRTAQLVSFYRQTINNAPRDYRWPIVLGRIETVAENYPAAIDAYEQALKARPDRPDVLQAKAGLEERLLRFPEATASYRRLYDLTYRDPQWLTKVAELEARQGQSQQAVRDLQAAIIGARSETTEADFSIAGYLESWHLLRDAVSFADRGARLASKLEGDDLITYTRILMLARRADDVLSGVRASALPQGFGPASTAGEIVATYYTPEEKVRFEQALVAKAASMQRVERDQLLLPLVSSAGLADLESRWRYESMAATRIVDPRFVELESARATYGDLGRQLEQFAAQNAGREAQSGAFNAAAQAYFDDNDSGGLSRVLRSGLASGPQLDRYFAQLAAGRPQELMDIIRTTRFRTVADRAIEAAIATDHPDLAIAALRESGRSLGPLWTNAYTALTGVYFDDRSAPVANAFTGILDTRTIGERLRTPPARDQMLTGPVWFYYAARFGEYLERASNADAQIYLPASLEEAPGNANAYLALGDFYAQAGQSAKAIASYEAMLQFDRDRGDAYDHQARVLWTQGRRADAIAQWHYAFAAFLRVETRGVRVPDAFWRQFAETVTDLGQRRVLADLRLDIENLLRQYIRINGDYRLAELLEATARASLNSGDGLDWLLALARATDSSDQVIFAVMRLPNLTAAQRISLRRAEVTIAAERASAAYGPQREYLEGNEVAQRVQLISLLLDAGDVTAATAEWQNIPQAFKDETNPNRRMLDEVEIRLVAKTGTLYRLLERYRAKPDAAPPQSLLSDIALRLRQNGDPQTAQALLDFLYDRELQRGNLSAANFLGLAEVRLEQQNAAQAVALLNRMVLVTDNAFDTFVPAAELLQKYGRTAEARDFLTRAVRAIPWNAPARVELARLEPASEREPLLAAALADSQAPYSERARAARLYRSQPVAAVAGTELAVLSSPNISAAAARKPYFVEARLAAAAATSDTAVRLALFREVLSISPEDERARLGAVQSAIASGRDSVALAMAQALPFIRGQQPNVYIRPGRFYRPVRRPITSVQPIEADQASLLESLSTAAERLGDLPTAQNYLRAAINLLPANQRGEQQTKLKAIAAEQSRRAANTARRPIIQQSVEQRQVVRPEIQRSAQ